MCQRQRILGHVQACSRPLKQCKIPLEACKKHDEDCPPLSVAQHAQQLQAKNAFLWRRRSALTFNMSCKVLQRMLTRTAGSSRHALGAMNSCCLSHGCLLPLLAACRHSEGQKAHCSAYGQCTVRHLGPSCLHDTNCMRHSQNISKTVYQWMYHKAPSVKNRKTQQTPRFPSSRRSV